MTTPAQACLISSTSGRMKTLIFLPGCFGPGITRLRNIFYSFIQRAGGRFKGITKTGQQEYCAFPKPKGLKPSVAIAIRTFLASFANYGWAALKCVHASASDGCTITLGLARLPSLCQRICLAVLGSMYCRCNLGMSGR